jgi:hypothetical protein
MSLAKEIDYFTSHTVNYREQTVRLIITLYNLQILTATEGNEILKKKAWSYSERHGTLKQIILDSGNTK